MENTQESFWDSALSFWATGMTVWAICFAVLFAVGMILSAITLSTAAKLAGSRTNEDANSARTLRTAYRFVVGLGSVGYYASLPLLVLTVLMMVGGLVSLCLSVGRIPVKLLLIVVVVGGASLIAILKGIFVRVSDEDPGIPMDLDKAPQFRQVLDEVAAAVQTRSVDKVYLTPGTDIAVFERGNVFTKLAGRGERCLVLGIGVLDNFQLLPFKSVLAHEYGHFSNKDTAGGSMALIARQALMQLGTSLANSGAAAYYNPAWLFFRGYLAAFLRISQGASRLQEILADRISIFQYGSQAFIDGYKHVLRQSLVFHSKLNTSVQEVLDHNVYVKNLYRYQSQTPFSERDVELQMEDAWNEEPSPYDSHPSPKQRVAWASQLAVPGQTSAQGVWVWDFIPQREALEEELTQQMKVNIAINHDISLPSSETASSAA